MELGATVLDATILEDTDPKALLYLYALCTMLRLPLS